VARYRIVRTLGRGSMVRLHRDNQAISDFDRAIELRPETVIALTEKFGAAITLVSRDRSAREWTFEGFT
jgi:hypothetical protein